MECLRRETMLFILTCFMNNGQVRQSGSVLLSGVGRFRRWAFIAPNEQAPPHVVTRSNQEANSKKGKKKVDLLQPHWEEEKEVRWPLVLSLES